MSTTGSETPTTQGAVAWLIEGYGVTDHKEFAKVYGERWNKAVTPLYAHPPQPSVSVACPAPTPDDETYYSKGKDANWLAALSDEDLAEAVCFAAQDLNDTGLGDDLDKWMPFQAMMCIAADRIRKLITASPSVSVAEAQIDAIAVALSKRIYKQTEGGWQPNIRQADELARAALRALKGGEANG